MNILSRSPYLRAALLFLLAFQLSSVAQPPPAAEKSGAAAEAKKQALAALEIAPSYVRAQDLLLRLVESKQ